MLMDAAVICGISVGEQGDTCSTSRYNHEVRRRTHEGDSSFAGATQVERNEVFPITSLQVCGPFEHGLE